MRLVNVRSIRLLSAGLVAAGGIALSATGAQASAATAASAPAPAPAKAKVPALSHQLCYSSSAKGFQKAHKRVEFADFFNPKGFVPLPKIGKDVLTCNPVRVQPRSGKRSPITDSAGHLTCFVLKVPHERLPAVKLADQFGTATVHVGQPEQACLPTWQNSRKAPKARTSQPPGIDHFTCYGVAKVTGRFRSGRLRLKDSFARKLIAARTKSRPTMLCATALMLTGSSVTGKVLHPGQFLICYPVTKTPLRRRVFALDQFGRATVTVGKTRTLCVPSHRP
jgi:hypothetical protein